MESAEELLKLLNCISRGDAEHAEDWERPRRTVSFDARSRSAVGIVAGEGRCAGASIPTQRVVLRALRGSA